MKKIIVLSMIVLLLCAGLVLAKQEQIEKRFDVRRGGLLTLDADFGSVVVKSWNREQVLVNVTKEVTRFSGRDAQQVLDNYEIDFRENSHGVTIIAEYSGSRSWWRSNHGLRVHFEITVPTEYDLDIQTSGGSIDVADLDGRVDLKTSGGSIDAAQINGDVTAKTSGGSISVQRAEGAMDVRTSGGKIQLGETSGPVYAKTSGGSVTVEGAGGDTEVHTSGGRLELREIDGNVVGSTSGGSIYAELIGKIDRDCSLKTSGGSIKLLLQRDIEVTVDAHTSGGRVSTDFPVTVQGKLKKNKLYGKINGGGPVFYLKTSGGSIYIDKL